MKLFRANGLMPPTFVVARRALMACALLPLTACIDEVETGDSTIRGTYTLRTVNGASLPYVKSVVGNTKVELLSDDISLFMGGTFSEEIQSRTTANGQVTTQKTTATGTYAPGFDNSVNINPNGGITRTVVIDNGRTMTHSDGGVVYVWKK